MVENFVTVKNMFKNQKITCSETKNDKKFVMIINNGEKYTLTILLP